MIGRVYSFARIVHISHTGTGGRTCPHRSLKGIHSGPGEKLPPLQFQWHMVRFGQTNAMPNMAFIASVQIPGEAEVYSCVLVEILKR